MAEANFLTGKVGQAFVHGDAAPSSRKRKRHCSRGTSREGPRSKSGGSTSDCVLLIWARCSLLASGWEVAALLQAKMPLASERTDVPLKERHMRINNWGLGWLTVETSPET